jgi:hypothetical protein
MSDLSFIRNIIETLPSLVEMARLHPELSHEEAATRWLSVPSSYVVPLSYTASDELADTIQQAEAEVARLKCCGNCGRWSDFDLCAEGGHDNYRGGDLCHFNPSMWTARAEADPE